jgi:hypothetical protein
MCSAEQIFGVMFRIVLILISFRLIVGTQQQCGPKVIQGDDNSCRWLYGEVPVTGLTNQINTIYMLLPLARLFNSSLILSPLYSRRNFEITMRQYDKDPACRDRLTFSQMIDMDSFLALAGHFGVRVQQQHQGPFAFTDCLEDNVFVNQFVHSVQRAQWRAMDDLSLLSQLQQSGYYRSPIAQNCPHVIRIKSISKLLGIYSFYQQTQGVEQQHHGWKQTLLDMLLLIHRHIKPAAPIAARATCLRESIIATTCYWAIHVRLEADVIRRRRPDKVARSIRPLVNGPHVASIAALLAPYQNVQWTDPLFFVELSHWLYSIYSSPCFQSWNQTGKPLPPLYVASGILAGLRSSNQSIHPNTTSHTVDSRKEIVLSLLRAVGFSNIVSKLDLNSSRDGRWWPPLHVELDGYVDLEVATRAECFIPAHITSSFSYLAQRFRELDQNITYSRLTGSKVTSYKHFFV